MPLKTAIFVGGIFMQLDCSSGVRQKYSVGDFYIGTTVVRGTTTGQFNCPHCDALYYLIETEAGSETRDRQLTCVVCDAPLPARKGPFVFKYLLSGSSPTRRKKFRKT